jgi:homoserine dehydrogenase
MTYRIALVGCGTVGIGFLKILRDKGGLLKSKYGFEAKVVAVSDKVKGAVLADDGLDLRAFVAHVEAGKPIGEFDPKAIHGLDSVETIRRAKADMVVEVAWTDIKTGEPASTHIREAFRAGAHVITTNKGPATLFHGELTEMAKKHNVLWRHEGVVMSGTPVFDLLEFCLAGNEVKEIKGILNGTTNFILTKMEDEGMAYKDALALAQKLGYAEADPTADVEGFDALAKILVLSNIVLGANLKTDQVARQGISAITLEDIARAKKEGKRYKLVASAKREGGKVVAQVKPVQLPLSDPLAGVGGAMNALTFHTDLSGPITIQGPGAGQMETGFAVLIDALNIHRACKAKGK